MLLTKREDTLFSQIFDGLLNGQFGKAGDQFMTVRDLAKEYNCSLHCALSVLHRLLERRILRKSGKRCYITTGRCMPGSAYEKTLTETQHQVFGILLSDNSNPFFGALTDRLQEVLRKNNAELIVASSSDPHQRLQILDLFVELKCRGVFNCVAIKDEQKEFYRFYPLPIVTMAEDCFPQNIDSVLVDNYAAGTQVAAHLLEGGCRSFVYITLDDYMATDMRLQGFRKHLASMQVDLDEENIGVVSGVDEALRKRGVRNFLGKLLANTTALPLGVFCVHDLLAVEVMRFIKSNSEKRFGEDVKVVGFDDLPITSMVSTPITTVSYPYSAMASKSVEIMQALLQDPLRKPNRYEIPFALIIRQSS